MARLLGVEFASSAARGGGVRSGPSTDMVDIRAVQMVTDARSTDCLTCNESKLERIIVAINEHPLSVGWPLSWEH